MTNIVKIGDEQFRLPKDTVLCAFEDGKRYSLLKKAANGAFEQNDPATGKPARFTLIDSVQTRNPNDILSEGFRGRHGTTESAVAQLLKDNGARRVRSSGAAPVAALG